MIISKELKEERAGGGKSIAIFMIIKGGGKGEKRVTWLNIQTGV